MRIVSPMSVRCSVCPRSATHRSMNQLARCFVHANALHITGQHSTDYSPTTTLWGQQLWDMMDATGILAPFESGGLLWDVGVPRSGLSLITYSLQVQGDINNGCSYRCAQMLAHALEPAESPPDIESVLTDMKVRRKANGSIPWSEPKNIGDYLFMVGVTGTHAMVTFEGLPSRLDEAKTLPRYAPEEKLTMTRSELEMQIANHFSTGGALPIMIDDTLFTYVIYGIRGGGTSATDITITKAEVLVADPHNWSGKPITPDMLQRLLRWHRSDEWFNRAWMVYYPMRPIYV